MNASLVQLQQGAVDRILATRQNGKRAAGYGMTFLNRSGRGLSAARRHYATAAVALGFSDDQVAQHWQDIKDIAALESASREA